MEINNRDATFPCLAVFCIKGGKSEQVTSLGDIKEW